MKHYETKLFADDMDLIFSDEDRKSFDENRSELRFENAAQLVM